jgi:hypothetical protein
VCFLVSSLTLVSILLCVVCVHASTPLLPLSAKKTIPLGYCLPFGPCHWFFFFFFAAVGLKLKISRTNQQTRAFQEWVENLELPRWVEDQDKLSHSQRRLSTHSMDQQDDEESSSDEDEDDDEEEEAEGDFASSPALSHPSHSEVFAQPHSDTPVNSGSKSGRRSESSSSPAYPYRGATSSTSTVVAPPPLMVIDGYALRGGGVGLVGVSLVEPCECRRERESVCVCVRVCFLRREWESAGGECCVNKESWEQVSK